MLCMRDGTASSQLTGTVVDVGTVSPNPALPTDSPYAFGMGNSAAARLGSDTGSGPDTTDRT